MCLLVDIPDLVDHEQQSFISQQTRNDPILNLIHHVDSTLGEFQQPLYYEVRYMWYTLFQLQLTDQYLRFLCCFPHVYLRIGSHHSHQVCNDYYYLLFPFP